MSVTYFEEPVVLPTSPAHIVHDLLQHGMNCQCSVDCERTLRVGWSREAFTVCENLTRPENLANVEDPLKEAFKMTEAIEKMEVNDRQAQKEWRTLVRRCKQFTSNLLNECSNGKEVAALFNFDEEDLVEWKVNKEANRSDVENHFVETLREAVDAHHLDFVAHRHSQHVLDTVIYSRVPNCLNRYFMYGFVIYAIFSLLFPICVVILILWPKCRASLILKTPFFKFVSHVSQFCVFLCLLVWSELMRESVSFNEPSTMDCLIFTFVLAMAGQELRKFAKEKSKYFQKWWNWISTTMLVLFLLSGLFFLVALVVDANQHSIETLEFKYHNGSKMFLLSNSFFSIACVISIFYLGSLGQVNSVFGPLQLSTLRMVKDILKFLTIFLGLFIAFTLGMRNLYSYNPNINNATVYSTHKLGSFWNAMETMFWAWFGQSDLARFNQLEEGFEIITETGKFLYGFFFIIAVLVGLNMLIAMMNNSYEYVTQDKNSRNWKFSRTSLWLEYIGKTNYHLPPPYNPLEIIFYVYEYCKGEKVGIKNVKQSSNEMLDNQKREERRNERRKVVKRYLENTKGNKQLQDLEETVAKLLQSLKEYSKKEDTLPHSLYYESNV